MITILPFLIGLLSPTIIPVVYIEGVMGAGKSTLIDYIDMNLKNVNYIIIREPETWINLSWATVEQRQRSQQFILFDMTKMVGLALQQKNISLIIMDRSPWSVCNVFMKMDASHLLSKQMCNFRKDFKHYIIYIQIKAEIAHSRLQNRNRSMDSHIPLEYIQLQEKLFNDSNITHEASLVV